MIPMRRIMKRIETFLAGRKAYKWAQKTMLAAADLDALRDLMDSTRLKRTMSPYFLEAPAGSRIVVLAPHPDDESIGPGGTLLQASRAGADISVVFLTSGGAGNEERREQEARKACNRLPADPVFLRLEEGGIDIGRAAHDLARFLRANPSDVIFLPFLADDHADHRAANRVLMAAMESVDLSRTEVWAYQVYSSLYANVAVDITDRIEEKCDLIRCHESQFKARDWAHYARGLGAFNSRLATGAKPKYLEVFFVVPAHEYRSLLERFYSVPGG